LRGRGRPEKKVWTKGAKRGKGVSEARWERGGQGSEVLEVTGPRLRGTKEAVKED